MSFQIAIDGPAGAGKSTVAKSVSARLGFIYVDTGAMYRASGLYMLEHGVDLYDEAAVSAAVADTDVSLRLEDGVQRVFLNGRDVTDSLRTEQVGMAASVTSAYPAVREKLVRTQQEIGRTHDVVMDGRDIGTAVLPEAPLKIYLTASVQTRAMRRFLELRGKGEDPDLAAIEQDIRQRDTQDMTRTHSPLRQAEDAVLVDSSDLGIEEVTGRILALAAERMQTKA